MVLIAGWQCAQVKLRDVLFLTERKETGPWGTVTSPGHTQTFAEDQTDQASMIFLLLLFGISHFFFTQQSPTLPLKPSSNDLMAI